MLQTQRQRIAEFSEINDHAEDVTAYYSALEVGSISSCAFSILAYVLSLKQPGVTYKIAAATTSRTYFVENGTLDGGVDQNFRALSQ